ncbi:MAG: hypothetical protein M1835_006375 [Candelina submexicana]|nr:MAG: hypothetical protein M1835_006375 [Candelina submexicana]
MSSWRTEYIAALEDRDRREKAHLDLFNAYSKLADRAASLETLSTLPEPSPEASSKSPEPNNKARPNRVAEDRATKAVSADALNRIRQDLIEAQRSKAELQARLKTTTEEAAKLKSRFEVDNRRLNELATERTTLAMRIRDRDEELRGKAKLLETVQDEMVSLSLQLNMAEERSAKLQRENEDLIARWMKRMEKEADAMNDASRFS